MKSRYNPGRVAGFLYLLLGFAVVRLKCIPGALLAGRAAAETTKNIAAHELLFRFGIVSDLITATAAIFVTARSLPAVPGSQPEPGRAPGYPRRADAGGGLLLQRAKRRCGFNVCAPGRLLVRIRKNLSATPL
jgi:hypothetical protein